MPSWQDLLAGFCGLAATRHRLLARRVEAGTQTAEFSAWAERALRAVMEDVERHLAIRVGELRRVTGCDIVLFSRTAVNAPGFAVAALRLAWLSCRVDVYAARPDAAMPRIHLGVTVIRRRGYGRLFSYPGYALVPGGRAGYELRDLRRTAKVESASVEDVTLRALELLHGYCSVRRTLPMPRAARLTLG
jgi:hypothetical protein